jgi:ComF family protein
MSDLSFDREERRPPPWSSRLRGLSRFMLDLTLPPLCAACKDQVGDDGGLCSNCWSQLSFITPPMCEQLGIPFAFDGGLGLLSMQAIADPPAYQRARAAVRYDDVARKLVHALKFNDRLDLGRTMAAWMAQAGWELLAEADGLVPVPLHWRRLWARRFNQSIALADGIAHRSGVPVLRDILKRRRATVQQVGLSRTERSDNVQGAFAVPAPARIKAQGRKLVLIDDVLTSGATVEACAKALYGAGAARVDVLVFARVVDATARPI